MPLIVAGLKFPKSLPESSEPDVSVTAQPMPDAPVWPAQLGPEVGNDCV